MSSIPRTRSPRKLSLSVVLITLNEQKKIRRCLQSLRFSRKVFARQEVIVVDAQSQDATVSLARKLGAWVYRRPWKGYSDQKNWALFKAKGDWILSLDADEELTPALVAEIEEKAAAASPGLNGFEINRRNLFLGKWISHSSWSPDYQLRLIRRGSGRFTNEAIHEGLEIKGRWERLEESMIHHSIESIGQYLDKINQYSKLDVLVMKPKKKTYWAYYLAVAPLMTFFRTFFSREGYLDGWHGFLVCGLATFHDFCRYAKLWEKEILKRHG